MNATETQFERYPIDGRPGYFLDRWGFEFYEAPDLDDMRSRLNALLGDDEPPAIVRAVAIDGRLPSVEQVAAVERELNKSPALVLRDFKARGGKIETIIGRDARLHPLTASRLDVRSCGGWFQEFRNLIVIAVESDPLVVLHELAHHYDRDGRRFSCLTSWRQICGPGPWEQRFNSPSEKFAEAFALHFHSHATRDRLGDTVQQFIERACA